MTFDDAFDKLIGHEGGYVYDPRDPGGETKYGISKRAYPDLNIQSLNLDDAKALYRKDYWDKLRLQELPEQVRYSLFDTAVNAGISQAVKLLQRAVGTKEDGIIGRVTIAEANALGALQLAIRYNAHRLKFLTDLKGWEAFGKGWARRVVSILLDTVK
jgi:lysozyme family protein